jgi:hypothetical protein
MRRFINRHAEPEPEVRDQQPPETLLGVAA